MRQNKYSKNETGISTNERTMAAASSKEGKKRKFLFSELPPQIYQSGWFSLSSY